MNIKSMMAQAKKMQAQVEENQKKLEKQEFTIKKQGITIVMSGSRKLLQVDINNALIDPDDKETLEDMIIIAVNEGLEQIAEIEKQNMPNMPIGV